MRRVKTLLLIFALSGKLLFCPGAFAQVDVENLGDDRPADIDIEEDFVPATHSQWLAFALKNLQNNHSNMACSALKLNYYHGFADDERITGSSAPFGNVTSDGYKASTSTPIASQNYIMGTKSYWKPVSVGFMDKQSFIRVRLEQRQNNSPIPISPEEEEEIRQLAAIDYYRERGYFVEANPEGAFVGWMKWTPVLYKEPLRISAAVAEKLNLPTDALTKNFVVDESEAKHDALIEGLGVQLAWEILRNLPNTTEVKPIIYQFVMRDPFSLTRITFKEYHIAYEICVNPSVHKAEGDFTDMWNAEQERISELIEEGSAFYYDPNSFHLQPRLYSHGIDDAPVGLAFWNHLRNRLRTAEDIANNAEFLKIMIQMPGYFVPLVNSGLSIRDYFYCEGSTLLACLAALGADVSSDVLLFMKIPVVAAKIAKGYTKTKKGAVGLKKAIEQGKDAEVYLTNVAEIIKKKASLGQVGAGALNFGLAAIYAAEGDLSMAAARVLAGSSDVGVFRISKKSLLFVPFGNIKTICADSKIGVKLRRLASNVEEFRQCKLSKITNGVENLPRQIDNAEVDRILTATGRNNPAGREIMEKYAEYMGHIPNNQKNIPSNTIAKTRKFYEEVLQPLGVSLSNTDDIIITEQVIQSIKSQGSLEARAEMAYKAWRDALKGLSPGYSMGGRHITLPGEIKIKMNDGSIRSISACDLGEEAFDMLMHTFNSTYLEEVSHALQFNLPTTLNANGYPWPPVNLISEYTSMKQWIENPANIDRIMELTQFNYPAETMRRNIERLSHVEVDPFILASRSANTRARRAVEMASYAKSNYPERDFFVLWKYETSGEFLGYSGDELLNTIRTKWAGY